MKVDRTMWMALAFASFGLTGCEREKTAGGEARPAGETTGVETPGSTVPPPGETTLRPPEIELRQARAEVARNVAAAGEQLRKAAVVLRDEAQRAVGATRTQLDRAAQELDDLATNVERGAVKSGPELDAAYSRVHLALAAEYNRRAAENFGKKNVGEAGEDLRAAAAHFENALVDTGRETDQAATDVVREVRAVADKLVAGTGWTDDEVRKSFTAMESEIQKLGHAGEPARPAQ